MTLEERMTKMLKDFLEYWGEEEKYAEDYRGGCYCFYCSEDAGHHAPDCFWVQLVKLARDAGWLHDWAKDGDGYKDGGAWSTTTATSGHHGPECVRCGYHYCEHCQQEKVLCPAESEPL